MNLGTLSPITSTRKSIKPWKRSTIERQDLAACKLQLKPLSPNSQYLLRLPVNLHLNMQSALTIFEVRRLITFSKLHNRCQLLLPLFSVAIPVSSSMCAQRGCLQADLSIQLVSSLYPWYDRGSWSTSIYLDCLRYFLM